ncbi:DUF5954 family protein [Streptomyces sp. SBR177]
MVPGEGRREERGGAACVAGRGCPAGDRVRRRALRPWHPLPCRAGRGVRGGRRVRRSRDASAHRPRAPTCDWSPGAGAGSPGVDEGLVLDPDAPLSPLQAAERLSLRSLAYSGTRFPAAVLRDSARAVETHPDVMLMPAAFLIVERAGTEPWSPGSGLQPTAHDARRALDFALTWLEPRQRGLIPFDADRDVDAHTVVAQNASPADGELAVLAEAAGRLRVGRLDQVEVHDTVYRIARIRRLLRWGPDGPEGPRPSDVNTHGPEVLHLRLDEHGTVHFGESAEEDADC